MIPKDIKEAVEKGLTCPLCKKGEVIIQVENIENLIPIPHVLCNHCFKELVIEYNIDPFEILEIVEKIL